MSAKEIPQSLCFPGLYFAGWGGWWGTIKINGPVVALGERDWVYELHNSEMVFSPVWEWRGNGWPFRQALRQERDVAEQTDRQKDRQTESDLQPDNLVGNIQLMSNPLLFPDVASTEGSVLSVLRHAIPKYGKVSRTFFSTGKVGSVCIHTLASNQESLASCLSSYRQLRHAGSGRGSEVGSAEHKSVWWGPNKCDNLRFERRCSERGPAAAVAPFQGTLPSRHLGKRHCLGALGHPLDCQRGSPHQLSGRIHAVYRRQRRNRRLPSLKAREAADAPCRNHHVYELCRCWWHCVVSSSW